MTREEYFVKVKEGIAKKCPYRDINRWNDQEWQSIINNMYNRFSNYTPEQQQNLIMSAGPIEPFWDRVVDDAVYCFYMWA